MSVADWRALIEAYLDARISAEAFARRYLDAWRASRDGGAPMPRAIEDLYLAVEAFQADSYQREGELNGDDMRDSARRALSQLGEDAPATARTFDRVRAQEEMRRFQVHVSGCAGLGCAIALIWVALCVLQIYYVSEWIQESLGWGAWPSAFIGFFLAFTPIVGNILAFLGATQEGWETWIAALVFFAAPAAALLSGWSRWRRTRRS